MLCHTDVLFTCCAQNDASVSIMCHALVLPTLALTPPSPPKRLSLVRETTGALKSLICDSPDNQEAAVKAGLIPCLVQVGHPLCALCAMCALCALCATCALCALCASKKTCAMCALCALCALCASGSAVHGSSPPGWQ
jgi:heme A synthase